MKVLNRAVVLALIGITLINCSYTADGKSAKDKSTAKGATGQMITYRIGRFTIDVPADFKVEHREHKFRLVGIEEFPVPETRASVQYAEQMWKERLLKIENLEKPRGVNRVVINEYGLNGLGHWSRGVLYYGDRMADDEASLYILVDYGRHLALFRIDGLLDRQEKMSSWMMEVVKAYRPLPAPSGTSAFYTEHGVIDLPYKRQESTYARFQGPMEMVLEVEMKAVQDKHPRKGLIARTAAAVAAGFARGIEVKKIRSKNRVEASLSGEEEVIQGNFEGKENLSFDWEYLGENMSGDHPMIQINLDTFTDHLPEKISIWDRVLSSFRPIMR